MKRAFRDEAQLCHPDRFSDSSESVRERAEARFKTINEAYQTIQEFAERFGNFSAESNIDGDARMIREDIRTTIAMNMLTHDLQDRQDRFTNSLSFWFAVALAFFVFIAFSAVYCNPTIYQQHKAPAASSVVDPPEADSGE